MASSDDKSWVVLGAIKGAHGVRGLARVASYTEAPEAIFAYAGLVMGPERTPVTLEKRGLAKGGFLARVSGLATREDVDAARGFELAVDRATLGAPEDDDAYYLTDLIGLHVQAPDGAALGAVRSVENFGAEDLLELALDTPIKGLGRFVFVPFRKDIITEVDISAGTVTADMARWQSDQTGKEAEPQGGQGDIGGEGG